MSWRTRVHGTRRQKGVRFQSKPRITKHIRTDIKESTQVDLAKSGFADFSIVSYVNRINRAGYQTIASCSGLRRDHHGQSAGAYLSVELPENVVRADLGGDTHEIDARNILNADYVYDLVDAGRRAGWKAELSKYMMAIGTVRFTIPDTGSVARDSMAENDLEWKAAEKAVQEAKSGPGLTEDFLKKLDERDAVRKRVLKRYGAYEKSDAEVLQWWKRLTNSLVAARKQSRGGKTLKKSIIDVYFYNKGSLRAFVDSAQELGISLDNIDVRTMDQIHRAIVSTDQRTLQKLKRIAEVQGSTSSIDMR